MDYKAILCISPFKLTSQYGFFFLSSRIENTVTKQYVEEWMSLLCFKKQ